MEGRASQAEKSKREGGEAAGEQLLWPMPRGHRAKGQLAILEGGDRPPKASPEVLHTLSGGTAQERVELRECPCSENGMDRFAFQKEHPGSCMEAQRQGSLRGGGWCHRAARGRGGSRAGRGRCCVREISGVEATVFSLKTSDWACNPYP